MQVEKIKLNMLGGFAVWVNGDQIVNENAKLTKPWQLFCYLVINRNRFVDSRKLISVLWGNDDLADPANVLKNAIYSLRKELCGGESSTESPIVYSSGAYRFDPSVELELDVLNFEKAYLLLEETEDSAAKIEFCQQIMNIYKGNFLPHLEQELWAIPLSLELKEKFLSATSVYCDLLFERKHYKEMLEVTQVAHQIEPLSEKIVLHMFHALDALRMYRVVVTTYSRVSQKFLDSLDAPPEEEVRKIYKKASERINKTEQDIIVIKTELSDIEQSVRPQRGAYFCSYTELKCVCPMLKRTAERNNQQLMIALFTLQDASALKKQTTRAITRAMAEFKVVAMNTLRKTDSIARYSKNQYVILVSVKSLGDGRMVRDKIKESFFTNTAEQSIALDIKLAEV